MLQRWDDIHFPQFQSGGCNSAAQSSEVIFVSVRNPLYQAMFSQPFNKSRYLMNLFAGQERAKITIAKSADVKLAADNGTEKAP